MTVSTTNDERRRVFPRCFEIVAATTIAISLAVACDQTTGDAPSSVGDSDDRGQLTSTSVSAWELAERVWQASFDEDAARFKQAAEQFYAQPIYLEKILDGLEHGGRTEREYQVAVGVVEAAIRMLDTGSITTEDPVGLHRRLLESAVLFDPEYTAELLTRWSRHNHLNAADFSTLVSMSTLEPLRRAALDATLQLEIDGTHVGSVMDRLQEVADAVGSARDLVSLDLLARLLAKSPDRSPWECMQKMLIACDTEAITGWALMSSLLTSGDPHRAAEFVPRIARHMKWDLPLPVHGHLTKARDETVELLIQVALASESALELGTDPCFVVLCASRASFLRHMCASARSPRTKALSAQWLLSCYPESESHWQLALEVASELEEQFAFDSVVFSRMTSGFAMHAATIDRSWGVTIDALNQLLSRHVDDARLHPLQRQVVAQIQESLR